MQLIHGKANFRLEAFRIERVEICDDGGINIDGINSRAIIRSRPQESYMFQKFLYPLDMKFREVFHEKAMMMLVLELLNPNLDEIFMSTLQLFQSALNLPLYIIHEISLVYH